MCVIDIQEVKSNLSRHYKFRFIPGDARALSVLAIFLVPRDQVYLRASTFHKIAKHLPPRYECVEGTERINEPFDLTQFLPRRGATVYRYLNNDEPNWVH